MKLKQISIFLENKKGRMKKAINVLSQADINIRALSIADTSEFGILRMLVSDPLRAKELLKEKSFTVNLTEVISIMTPNEAKYYALALKILSDKEISIEYTYAFSIGEKSIIVLRCNNAKLAIEELKKHEMELVKASDLYKI